MWEARLESMAPDIDGKLYLTDIELPSGEIAEHRRRDARGNHQDGRVRLDRPRGGNTSTPSDSNIAVCVRCARHLSN